MRALAGLRRMADTATAAVVWSAALLTTDTGHHLRDGVAAGLAAVACAALAVRRRWPYTVLLISTVAAEAYLGRVAGGGGTLILAAPLIALYTVAESGPRRRSVFVAVLLVLLIGVFHTAMKAGAWLGAENVALAALGALAVAAGEAARNRRAYLAEAMLRAQQSVAEQRLRIARDLHDNVGHHLALINVQAGVAGHVLTGQPAQVHETLEQIRHSSRSALNELRDAVGLLRGPDDPVTPVEPAVGVAALESLIDTFTRTGLTISVCHEGDGRELSPATDVVAYRVIQESLTNVRKHAGAVPVRLILHYQPKSLTIVIENDAPAGPELSAGAGHGLTGMRERLAAIGGELDAQPRPLGGFRVTARLPMGRPS